MSKKTTATTATTATQENQVEVLSIQDKKFIDVEMVDVMAQAHNAGLKRSELVFQVANASKSLVKECTKEKWELVWADFENRLVNTKEILPSTARNYRVEVVKILKADGIEKPKGNSKTAKHEQAKKANKDAIDKKYEHESIENLTSNIVQLAGLTDKDSVQKFKEVTSVMLKKTKEKAEQDKQNESQELRDFKSEYSTWFNGLLKTQEGRTELVALRLNKEVRAVLIKVTN
jgi:hypothetical protein